MPIKRSRNDNIKMLGDIHVNNRKMLKQKIINGGHELESLYKDSIIPKTKATNESLDHLNSSNIYKNSFESNHHSRLSKVIFYSFYNLIVYSKST